MNGPASLPRIVGLSGYAGSGKDAVADILQSKFGYRRIAFADRLKDFIAAVFPDVAAHVDAVGWDQAKEQIEVRRALQAVGQAAKDHIHPDVWIISALGDMSDYDDDRIVISDVRFLNEADVVSNRGGLMLRVERNGVGPVNDDVSETTMERYDRYFSVILNNGTLEDLEVEIATTLDDWSLMQSARRVTR